MLLWSELFETKIELVDTQHKRLCALLNTLANSFASGTPSENVVADAIQELVNYAHQHFTDEETLMSIYQIDRRHITVHRMEHNSFTYDLSRLQLHSNVDEDEVQLAEKLVRFISSWLVYHILGMDKLMAAQIHAIRQGMTPQDAYQTNKTITRDAVTTQLVLTAILDLWRDKTEYCNTLKEKLACYEKQQ